MGKRIEPVLIRKIIWSALALMIMITIFVFSSQGTNQSEDISDRLANLLHVEQMDEEVRVSNQPFFAGLTLRKMAHVFLFFLLSFCVYQATENWKGRVYLTVGFCYLYGVLDEVHQYLIGRYARWEDTIIDLIGIVLGVSAALLLPIVTQFLKERLFHKQ